MSASTVVVTGSASGMGSALAERLAQDGVRVIGVDVRSADIKVDLGTPTGRRRAVEAISALGPLDGVVTFAGVSGHGGAPARTVVSVDHFGTVDLLAGLRPSLVAGGGAAIAISSIGAAIPDVSLELVEACLADDELRAREIADVVGPRAAYVGSKMAINRWVRRHAPTAEWIGSGVNLNVIAPGMVATAMVAQARTNEVGRAAVRDFPVPIGRPGDPDEIAAIAEFLLGEHARFMVGSIVVVDGGTDAATRPEDWPRSALPSAPRPSRGATGERHARRP